MKWLLLLVYVLGTLAFVAYPKESGGAMCGPVCPPKGLHTWERVCLGVEQKTEFIDGYTLQCYGIPIGDKKCYGVAFFENESRQLSCNYPCTDKEARYHCLRNERIEVEGVSMDCDDYKDMCLDMLFKDNPINDVQPRDLT